MVALAPRRTLTGSMMTAPALMDAPCPILAPSSRSQAVCSTVPSKWIMYTGCVDDSRRETNHQRRNGAEFTAYLPTGGPRPKR